MTNIFSVLSDETLEKIAAGGDLYKSMTDSELEAVAAIEAQQPPQQPVSPVSPIDPSSAMLPTIETIIASLGENNPPTEMGSDTIGGIDGNPASDQFNPNVVGGAIGEVQTLVTPKEAKAMPEMRAATKGALRVQAQGGPTAYDDDGSVVNWLGNLWNTIAYNSSGKVTAKSTNKHTQAILRGTVNKDGREVPLTQLDDDELDYLVDSAGWNGWKGWLGSFVGNRADDGIMQQWDRTAGATIQDPIARKAARVKYAQDIARGMIEQQESEKLAAGVELENRPKHFGADVGAGFVETASYMLPYLIPHTRGIMAGIIEAGDRTNELLNDVYYVDDNGTIRVKAQRDSTGAALAKGAARGAIAPLVEKFGGEIGASMLGAIAKNTLGRIPLIKAASGKVVETAAGKAVSKWMNSMSRLGKYTGMQSMPVEMLEEFEDQVLDAGLGLNLREGEKNGTTGLSRAMGAAKEFFKPENLRELAESMILIQVLGGGVAAMNDRRITKHLDGLIAKEAGITPEELSNYSLEDKQAAYQAFVEGLSEAEVARRFNRGAEAINKLANTIRDGNYWKDNLDSFKEEALASMDEPAPTPDAESPKAYASEGDLLSAEEAQVQEQARAEWVPAEKSNEVTPGAVIELPDGTKLRRNIRGVVKWQLVGGAKNAIALADSAAEKLMADGFRVVTDASAKGKNNKGVTTNETGSNEAPAQPEQEARLPPPAGEEARPLEAGEAPSEVGGEVAATQPAVEAPTSASTGTQANTPPTTTESAERNFDVADDAVDVLPTTDDDLPPSDDSESEILPSFENPEEKNSEEGLVEEELDVLPTTELPPDPKSTTTNRLKTAAGIDPTAVPTKKTKVDKLLTFPDSLEKYGEMTGRLLRTLDKGGVFPDSPKGKSIKAELARMDEAGWGEVYKAQMDWAGSPKDTRGEQPPRTPAEFAEWKNRVTTTPIDNTIQNNYNNTQVTATQEGTNNEGQQTQESVEGTEDEFRRVQEESKAVTADRRRLFGNGSLTVDVSMRDRLAGVLQRRVERERSDDGSSTWVLKNPKTKEDVTVKKVSGKTFYDCFSVCHPYLVRGDQVELHAPDFYEKGFGIISNDGLAGFFITESGDAVSGYSLQDNTNRGQGFFKTIAPLMKQYAKTTDCFKTNKQDLPGFYAHVFGFQTASIIDFNYEIIASDKGKEYADWFVETYGEAPVYFMVNVGHKVTTKHFDKDSYDAAVSYQQQALTTPAPMSVPNDVVEPKSLPNPKLGSKKKTEAEKLEALTKRNIAKAKAVFDFLKANNPNATLDPYKLRYSQANTKGLKLDVLRNIVDIATVDDFIEQGLTNEQAEELFNAITVAYQEQSRRGSNSSEKASNDNKVSYAHGAMLAIDKLRNHPDDLKVLANAMKRVSDAFEFSRRRQNSAVGDMELAEADEDFNFWQSKHNELQAKFNALSESDREKVVRIRSGIESKRDMADNQNEVSLNAGENGGNIDIADSNAQTPGGEGGATTTMTGKGSVGTGGSLAGNRHIRIDRVDGDSLTATMVDAAGKKIGTKNMTRAQWEVFAKATLDDDIEIDPKNPQVGDMIRLSNQVNTESQEERDRRFAEDKNYQAWLKRQNANDADKMRERYEQESAKIAAGIGRNFIGGMKVNVVDREYIEGEDGESDRNLRDPNTQKVVGTWNRKTNELTLFRGANASTLVHELGGHAAYQFAQEQAAQGDKTLFNKMNECIEYALTNPKMKPLIEDIRSRYPEATEEVMRDEIFAALMERNSPIMQGLTKTLQGKAWYNRTWQAIKDAFRAMLTKMGFNKADLSGIDKMQPEEFMSWLDRTMADGKRLGALVGMELGDRAGSLRQAFISPMRETMQYSMGDERTHKIIENVSKFEDMELMGIDRNTIWEETGLWRGKDGEIRTEVPDIEVSNGFIRYMQLNANVEPVRPLRVVDAENGKKNEWFFRLYPEFRNLPIVVTKLYDNYLGGFTGDRIEIDRSLLSDPDMFKAVLVHELQHAIQQAEGFSSGTNVKKAGGFDKYERTTGEVEARNVMARLALSPEGRKAVPPWETEDVAEDEQIVTWDNGGRSEAHQLRKATTTTTATSFMDDKRSRSEILEEKLVDSTAPIKSVQKEIDNHARANGEEGVEEVVNADGSTDWRNSTDFVAAKDKENGHLERNIRELKTRYIDPAMEALAKAIRPNQDKADLITDFNLYLQCKHAAARNRKIANDRGDTYTADYSEGMGMVTLPDGRRVGLSENVANQLLATMERKYGAKFNNFDDAAQSVYKMLEADLYNRYQSGLLSAEDWVKYMERRQGIMDWGTYIPLKDDLQNTEAEAYKAVSFSPALKRNEFMKAKGRGENDIADSPFAAAVLQAEQGIRRSSRNVLANVEANLAAKMNGGFAKNGMTDFSVTELTSQGQPAYAEVVAGVDARRTGTEFEFTFADGDRAIASAGASVVANRPDIHLFKRDGKLYAIRYPAGANGRGIAVANAFSGENMGNWGKGMSWVPRVTHWLSSMRTQYSPEFTVSNMLSDNLEALQALVGRYGLWDGGKAFGKALKYQWKNRKDLWHYVKTGEARGLVKNAIDAGILTKGGVVSQGIDAETKELTADLDKFIRKQKRLSEMNTTDMAKSFGRNVVDYISMANSFAEYSTRIGIASALEEYGVPRKDAIKFARDATVNFNRKGTAMPYINGLYMFANAAVQGAMRSVQSFQDDFSNAAKSPKGQLGHNKHKGELVGMLVVIGVAKAILDNALGDDDEREKEGGRNAQNLSEYDRKHNVGLPIGGGRQIVPLRFRGPYAAIPYLAQTFTRYAMGDIDAGEVGAILASELGAQTTELIGGNGVTNDKGEYDTSLFMQSIAPTLVDPFVQMGTGKDYKGDNRLRKKFDDTMPDSSNGKRNTPGLYKGIAQVLNYITGGNENRIGKFDAAPENVQLLVEFIGGAPLRDINNVVSSVKNATQYASGGTPEKPLSQIPFVRRFVREYPDVTGRYYDVIEMYERDKAEYKKTTRLEDRRELRKDKPYLSASNTNLDKLIERVKELTHLERGEVKRGRKWVEPKVERSEQQKENYRKQRLKLQATILKRLGE